MTTRRKALLRFWLQISQRIISNYTVLQDRTTDLSYINKLLAIWHHKGIRKCPNLSYTIGE